MQIACGNRKSASCSNINRAIFKSELVFPTEQFPCQYQAAINLCKQSFVDTHNKIKTQANKVNRFAMYLTCFGCPGASNKAKIKVNTTSRHALFSYFRFSGNLFPVVMIDGE